MKCPCGSFAYPIRYECPACGRIIEKWYPWSRDKRRRALETQLRHHP